MRDNFVLRSEDKLVVEQGVVRLGGLGGAALPYLISELFLGGDCLRYFRNRESGVPVLSSRGRPLDNLLVVCADTRKAEELISDLEFLLKGRGRLRRFFPWEVLPFDGLSPPQESSAERISTLKALLSGNAGLVVAPMSALQQSLPPPALLKQTLFSLKIGQEIDRDGLVQRLAGYQRTSLVEECGQLAVRGAIVDFYPAGLSGPVRIEFFGDVIESIRYFDPASQRSSDRVEQLEVLPVREIFFDYQAHAGATIERAVERIKLRGRELELPDRMVQPYLEALRGGESYPGLEHLQPLLLAEDTPRASLWNYLPTNTQIVLVDESALERSAEDFEVLLNERAERALHDGIVFPEPFSAYFSASQLLKEAEARASYAFNTLKLFQESDFEEQPEGHSFELSARPEIYPNSDLTRELRAVRTRSGAVSGKLGEQPLKPLADKLRELLNRGYRTAIVISQQSRFKRFRELLVGYDLGCVDWEGSFQEWRDAELNSTQKRDAGVTLIAGTLQQGFRTIADRIAVISEAEIFPESASRKISRSSKQVRKFLGSLAQLKEGDPVVHTDHGIGRYLGLKQLVIDGSASDFLQLEYAEGTKLFLPVENIGKVQKYVGTEGLEPELNRLGTKNWERAKEKVKASVAELAGQLINLYAARTVVEGFSFGDRDLDDDRFAETFPYSETPDQEQAIADVLKDMARSQPMDRLVCGDVGYGKTEVAIRAAFKAINSGKQVAILVPTTILADQHYGNFKDRFSGFPFTVGCVSRFFSSAQNKETLEKVAQGRVDLVIGTHRLLQRDVLFKDLGLLIIDEEHRFGVAHKERLKKYRREVDVLTLTATPIPRTLHMSLLGIRDLSVIETPPTDRHAIRTFIAPYNEGVVREAIIRELSRSGQVFYIHNRVQSIAGVADEVRALVPEARIEVAHGQMEDEELEKVMHRFVNREIDVLVSTTIVESGLDIPNANTIIIRKADAFGLAELYQLRGRVGRGARRAYAYLLISDPKTLGADARKRLAVLQSLDDLGMGFRLALQDMEIRGAGNLLGKDQTGQVMLVGYDLYAKILEEAVRELKQKVEGAIDDTPAVPTVDPELSVGFPAHIPSYYIPDVGERLMLYQRMVELRDREHGFAMSEEIEDRFGKLPPEVEQLLDLMIFRAALKRGGIVSASYRGKQLSLAFHQQLRIDPQRLVAMVSASQGRIKVTPDRVMKVALEAEQVTSPQVFTDIVEGILAKLEPGG